MLFVSAPDFVCKSILGSPYASAAPALHILGVVLGVYIAACPFPYLLTSLGEQRFVLLGSCVSTAIRIVLDVILTKFLNFRGPCYAVLFSESLLLCLWVVRLTMLGYRFGVQKIVWRPGLAVLIVGSLLYLTGAQTIEALLPLYVAGILIYLALILKLGAFSVEELALAREGFGFVRGTGTSRR
jgi:O-antigen/teichoic acid export membrane protein